MCQLVSQRALASFRVRRNALPENNLVPDRVRRGIDGGGRLDGPRICVNLNSAEVLAKTGFHRLAGGIIEGPTGSRPDYLFHRGRCRRTPLRDKGSYARISCSPLESQECLGAMVTWYGLFDWADDKAPPFIF